ASPSGVARDAVNFRGCGAGWAASWVTWRPHRADRVARHRGWRVPNARARPRRVRLESATARSFVPSRVARQGEAIGVEVGAGRTRLLSKSIAVLSIRRVHARAVERSG